MAKYIYNVPVELSFSDPSTVLRGCISITTREHVSEEELKSALKEAMDEFTRTNYLRTAHQFAEVLEGLYPDWDVALSVITKPVNIRQEPLPGHTGER